jgi:hypothetical protein
MMRRLPPITQRSDTAAMADSSGPLLRDDSRPSATLASSSSTLGADDLRSQKAPTIEHTIRLPELQCFICHMTGSDHRSAVSGATARWVMARSSTGQPSSRLAKISIEGKLSDGTSDMFGMPRRRASDARHTLAHSMDLARSDIIVAKSWADLAYKGPGEMQAGWQQSFHLR